MFTRSQKCGLTPEKSWAPLLHVTDSWAGTGARPLSVAQPSAGYCTQLQAPQSKRALVRGNHTERKPARAVRDPRSPEGWLPARKQFALEKGG